MKDSTALIKESVARLLLAKRTKEKAEKYYNDVRKKEQLAISNYMFSNLPKNESSFEIRLKDGVEFYENPVNLRVNKIRKKKIIWNVDKLKKKLDKKVFKKVVSKTYTISDMDGLVKYLKACGVDAKKFRKYITVTEEVQDDKIDNLYEVGEITKEDTAGCYTVECGEPYITLRELNEQ